MKAWLKFTLGFIVIVVIAGAGFAWWVYHKPHRDINNEIAVKVPVNTLLDAFKQNEKTASTQYTDKVLELTGIVKEASKNAIVFVDEAYIDFTKEQSLSNLVIENKNLIITKTFSKMHGLAGARIGYAIAASATIDELSALKSSPNLSVSVVSTAAAMASLNDEKFINQFIGIGF